MASTSETGHAKNVANFKKIVSFCKGYKTKYNPSRASIKMDALDALITEADAIMQALKTEEDNFNGATNERMIYFEPLKVLSTRIINALKSTEVSEETKKDARTVNKKLQGRRANPKDKPTPIGTDQPLPTDNSISVSQQSYDSLIDNFEKLVVLVSSETNYAPNEPELSVAGLQATLTEMERLNQAVIDKFTALSNVRINRNNLLYNPVTGMGTTIKNIKSYVLSVFTASSPEYKQISGIQFKPR